MIPDLELNLEIARIMGWEFNDVYARSPTGSMCDNSREFRYWWLRDYANDDQQLGVLIEKLTEKWPYLTISRVAELKDAGDWVCADAQEIYEAVRFTDKTLSKALCGALKVAYAPA